MRAFFIKRGLEPSLSLICAVAIGALSATTVRAGVLDFEDYENLTDLSSEDLSEFGVTFWSRDICEVEKGSCYLTGIECEVDDDCYLTGDKDVDYGPCGGLREGRCGPAGRPTDFLCDTDADCVFRLEDNLPISSVTDAAFCSPAGSPSCGNGFTTPQGFKAVWNGFAVCFDEPVGEVEWLLDTGCGPRGPHVHIRDVNGDAYPFCSGTGCTLAHEVTAPIECVAVRSDGCSIFDVLRWRPSVCSEIEAPVATLSRSLLSSFSDNRIVSVPDPARAPAPGPSCPGDAGLPANYVTNALSLDIDVVDDEEHPVDLLEVSLRRLGADLDHIVDFEDTSLAALILNSVLPSRGVPDGRVVSVPITFSEEAPASDDLTIPAFSNPYSSDIHFRVALRDSFCDRDAVYGTGTFEALVPLPLEFPRMGCRQTRRGGHDGWAARRTVNFIAAHLPDIPQIGDVSAEHGLAFGGHSSHRRGVDFDTRHFADVPQPPGVSSPSYPNGAWNYWKLQVWAIILGLNPGSQEAFEVLRDFANETRSSLQNVLADTELRLIILGDGHPVHPLADRWLSSLVNRGVLPVVGENSGVTEIDVLPFPSETLQTGIQNGKIRWRDDHNDHNHFSLCPNPCQANGFGGCSGVASCRR